MNLLTLIVGMPSTGKTTSLRNLGKDTVVYNTEKKMLPFKSNGIHVNSVPTTEKLIQRLEKFQGDKYPEIRNIVIDSFSDYTDMLLAECRAKHSGYDVFNAYNTEIFRLFQTLKGIENKYVFLTGHPEILTDADGNMIFRMSVKGKPGIAA